MRVATVAEMREMDAYAVENLGVPELLLMENAGHAAFAVILDAVPLPSLKRAAVICGVGNNGGDGLVVARLLHSAGVEVRVHIAGNPASYRPSARVSYDAATRMGLLPSPRGEGGAERALLDADVVVDALFGTGLTRDVAGDDLRIVDWVKQARGRGAVVVSLDIPSGVQGDTGQVMGRAVEADHTVTFGLPKLGNLLYPGHALGGQLWVSPISFPPSLRSRTTAAAVNLPPELPPRRVDGHKGSYGDALFVAGSRSYLGAPVFAARTHLRSGGGYARLATPTSLACHVASVAPEVVLLPQPETEGGSLSGACLPALKAAAEVADITVVGPGLSLDHECTRITVDLVRAVAKPVVVDGDGLSHLASDPSAATERRAPLVLTPHPGELARLLGCGVERVLEHRLDTLREAVDRYHAIVVSKGAHSLIGLPDGSVWINPSGNSGMATPGSGDVLTGAIAAMYGLGLEVGQAVRTAVFLHGLAGDLAARDLGKDGITATDVADRMPVAVRRYREDRDTLLLDCYGKIKSVYGRGPRVGSHRNRVSRGGGRAPPGRVSPVWDPG